ncbi:MAG: extracellular solute-binding protein, partial [Oscillospiraceae bacterium]
GLYSLEIEYNPKPGRSRDVEIAILLNGELPFKEAAGINLPRIWQDKGQEIATDSNNNDIRPSGEEILFEERGWISKTVSDSSGFQVASMLFDLKDANKLTIFLMRESVTIHAIHFVPSRKLPTYEEYSDAYRDIPDATASLDDIQAEKPSWKNAVTLVASSDRSTPSTIPSKGSKISLNMIGGNTWSAANQELGWKFTPTETGMYEIRLKCRQNFAKGFYSTRVLKINGKIPFVEAADLRFVYNRQWVMHTVSAGNQACKFFFEKGKTYDLSLSVALGDFGEILGETQQCIDQLNTIYREFLMIMGSTPDTVRDYNLDKQIPETIEKLGEIALSLDKIYNDISLLSGFTGSELLPLQRMSIQLKSFFEKPNLISQRLSYYKDNIASLNSWMSDAKSRPLELDYISIAAPAAPVAKADAGFLEKVVYQVKLFVASFVEDYNSLASSDEKAQVGIAVWTTAGRDQASLLNDMIRSFYSVYSKNTMAANVNVKLSVVSADAILPSVAAGNGPDILLNSAMQMPIDYALRKANVDLRELCSDGEMQEVLSRFRKDAIIPFSMEDKLFALPEQQTFPIMFYRSDVLAALNIPYPSVAKPWSWDDFIKNLQVLQKNNMSILMETGANPGAYGNGTYNMFLYQNGGKFYNGNGISCALDSEIAVESFKYWTNLYTSYGMPTNFNIANRFRTGESPIVISDFTLYNTLAVSAPELAGLWEIAPVPGTKKSDNTLDHSVQSNVTGVMMLSSCVNRSAAWNFMKWWTEKDAQAYFAREMESLLGTSARYPSANVEAFSALPWSARDYEVLTYQADRSFFVPEVPGGYYVPRHINNAFRSVCIKDDSDDPREAILYYSRVINDEIYQKRSEFSMPT